jgi:hypothetical protein
MYIANLALLNSRFLSLTEDPVRTGCGLCLSIADFVGGLATHGKMLRFNLSLKWGNLFFGQVSFGLASVIAYWGGTRHP